MSSLYLPDEAATVAVGQRLAKALAARAGAVIYLEGELGAGKTALVRSILRALGVDGTVRSPTYTLMEPYEVGGRRILHLDLYRLNDPLELENLGLDEFSTQDTLWFVEWPDRGAPLLPAPDWRLQLTHEGEGRRIDLLRGRDRLGPPLL